MAFYTGILTPPVNAYHRNSSLLLQFILFEFVTAYAEAQKLAELCHIKPTPLSTANEASLQSKACQSEIKASLAKLIGSSHGNECLVSWRFEEGPLSKLKTYCTLFAQNNERDEKELLGMQHYIDKAWQYGLQANNLFHSSKEARPQFLSSLEKMKQSMERFAKQISRILSHFYEDENILFFLLRYRSQLENIYAPRFVTKLFSKMYPKGLREIKQLLKTKYSKRGFINISSSVDSCIAELEAANL